MDEGQQTPRKGKEHTMKQHDSTVSPDHFMSAKSLDELGGIIDTCDNFLMYYTNEVASYHLAMRFEALGTGLTRVRAALHELYTVCGGEDIWTET